MGGCEAHILLVEDDESHAELIRRALSAGEDGFRLNWARDLRDAREQIRDSPPDLVIVDLVLPDGRGVALLEDGAVREGCPVIVVTAQGDEQAAVEAMKAGALDYVVKSPQSFANLPTTIRRALREWEHIVRRRDAEEELEVSRAFLRTVINTIPDPVVVLEPDGRVVLANRAARDAMPETDFSEEGATCHGALVGRRTPCPASEPCPLREVLEKARSVSRVRSYRRGDGERRTIDVHAAPLCDESGAVVRVVQVWRDITDLVNAQEEIASLARFPSEDPNPVLRISADGVVLYANEAGKAVLSAWGGRVGSALRGEALGCVEHALREDRCVQMEHETDEQTYLLFFAPVVAGGYVNVYGLDITERLRLEERLRVAQRMEAIGRLTGGIAHDFNNLLTPILGYSEFLQERVGQEPALREALEQIREAARRAAEMTAQLLAMGRRQVLRPEVLDLDALVAAEMKLLRRLVREDIALEFPRAGQTWPVRADAAQIRQVLMNLVINAADAIRQAGRIEIRTANAELVEVPGLSGVLSGGRYVVLAVQDDGCGMDAETVGRIFEPFFTTKAEGTGTGLGLATAHGIARQHGGDILVRSEVGVGSTFEVYLPACERPEAAPEGGDAAGEADWREGTETILVVEDDPGVGGLVREALKDWGYRVLLADDPTGAMDLAAREDGPIDLLLTDVILPRIDGRELHARLSEARPELKVMYMSGHAHEVIAPHGVLDESILFLQKPFDLGELGRKVRQALDG